MNKAKFTNLNIKNLVTGLHLVLGGVRNVEPGYEGVIEDSMVNGRFYAKGTPATEIADESDYETLRSSGRIGKISPTGGVG